MRLNNVYLAIFVGFLFFITGLTSVALAGDPLKNDEAFLDSDPDNDGIPTWWEFLIGTDPYNSDSDNDGLPDDWEIENLLDPADSSDAHKDYDYDPSTNFSVGEREAAYEAIKKAIDIWPSNRDITFSEPVFNEDGAHYDNYEEYYRPYHDQFDNNKIKIMKTKPTNPDCDGDGVLDPDDYEPFNYKNDGLGLGGADAPEVKNIDDIVSKVETVTNPEVQEIVEPIIPSNEDNNYQIYESFDIEIEQTPTKYNEPLFTIDTDNDGF